VPPDKPEVGEEITMTFWGEVLNKFKLHALKDVLVNLEFLADAEAQISEFYRQCAKAMATEQDLWNSLADQETQHSEIVWRLHALIAREPKLYSPGLSFSTVSIRMFAVEMQSLVEKINQGNISADRLFTTAIEIEDSVIELCYGEIVTTSDESYNELARQLDRESAEHKSAITLRMNAAHQRAYSHNSNS
jgi:hypothetical protein